MQINRLKESLISIAIGIRFRANFSVEDKLGNMVDEILYSRNAFFNPSFFPSVRSGLNEKILLNEETGNSLTINTSNIVLELHQLPSNSNNAFTIEEGFNRDIIKGIMKVNKIAQDTILRYLTFVSDIPDTSLSTWFSK